MITKDKLERLSEKQRRKLSAYINFLLWLQRVPIAHDFIKRLGDSVIWCDYGRIIL